MSNCGVVNKLCEPFAPEDQDGVYVSWTDKLNGAAMLSSEWVLPEGWAISSELFNGEAIVDGVTEQNVNGGVFTAPLETGYFVLNNRVTIEGGLRLTRGVLVEVSNCA